MAIAPGTRLGVYEVVAQIGAGGMGEVYRAHDTRLNRDVALKVLPEAFARDSQRMARFEREAKLLASLNHPNIAAIYGLEESGPIRALVMELVKGPTLAERIRGGALPIDEALPFARQVADAVEYAHENNVIHRDLKPANIKVRDDGTAKVLDFGLAKALSEDSSDGNVSNSPTLSLAATRQGVILGTAAYMSPEQARGKEVDRRTDVWAFGAVLYEMLTGKQAFEAEDISLTLAAVMKSEPDWQALPRDLPPSLSTVLHRCLQKDPKQRLRDIGDVRLAMEGAFETGVAPQVDGSLAANSHTTWRSAFVIGLCALLLGAGIAGLAVWILKPVPALTPVSRSVINIPPGDQLNLDLPDVAISPDGKQIAYVATRSGVRQIYVRALDSLEAKPLADTVGASNPFFSPDGEALGFFAAGKLKRISVSGGASLGLSPSGTPRGASWGSGGTIAFSTGSATIQQISDNGGPRQSLTKLENGDASHRWPDLLPGNRAVFFATSGANAQVVMQLLPSDERRILAPTGTAPRYAASGHLLYVQGGNLMAVPFDLGRLQVSGSAVPVVEGVSQDPNSGSSQYSVSANGTLLYVPGGAQAAQHLVWVTRNGKEQALPAPPHEYLYPRISPDGQRIALTIAEPDPQIWIYNPARDTLTRLTFSGTLNREPTWTPDGKRVAFISNKDGQENIFWQMADGSGQAERLATSENRQPTGSFSPDGKLLAYAEVHPATGYDIWVLNVNDHKAQLFLRTPSNESTPIFSPDGRWLAYVSDESSRLEVYVQPYPGPGGKYQISTDGGNEVVWNPNGKELFYRNGDKMMAVDVSSQPAFSAGKPRMLFEGSYVPPSLTAPFYDVSPDGQRFLMIKQDEQAAQLNQIVVVQNWFEELKRRVPTGTK